MSGLVRKALVPWNMLVASSATRLSNIEGPLKAHVDAAQANGNDLTAAVWDEFKSNQMLLLKYRFDRFLAEYEIARYGGISLATTGYKESVKFARFLTRVLAVFICAVMFGRQSVYPLLPPGSKFMQQIEQMTPAERRRLGY